MISGYCRCKSFGFVLSVALCIDTKDHNNPNAHRAATICVLTCDKLLIDTYQNSFYSKYEAKFRDIITLMVKSGNNILSRRIFYPNTGT